MILGSVSLLDCFVFLLFLAPQILLQVGIRRTAIWLLGALPSLVSAVLILPFQLLHDRYLTPYELRSPFVQRATVFQDVVIRCVRYAFAHMPAFLGRVFFSKHVALPFLRFRMLRHGIYTSPVRWVEIERPGFKGIWVTSNHRERPDIIVYYCHGGGFSMGSTYFYLEFLLAWVSLLEQSGYRAPALLALEYTLVPDATYPTQLEETLAGYEYVLSMARDSSTICMGGDSAGATLILSLLLHTADHHEMRHRRPGLAVLISPWTSIISPRNKNTRSDYLDSNSLERYGSQYIGNKLAPNDPTVSPGHCKDVSRWRNASPKMGWLFLFGSEEVLAPETRDLCNLLERSGVVVEKDEEKGGIHAWPVASLYLGTTKAERLHGLRRIAQATRTRIH
ncbi:alpha/beta-hydrolase [Westerdykella ornata]|uniref:Alpha/beta-hydrolase n=1 Tax=Westerdykella ornata TaxID=318751 RepID=A0A6A6JD56_WESOR|nr:alpha/beta-hydrolase [Westerdykella ornata]KAF2274491.1 alpha/beta-hydrolase [Westerdykella ornata]